MASTIASLLRALGLVTWGDLGPFTIYRNKRGKIVWFPKAPPEKPPSSAQIYYRNKWRSAAEDWRDLPDWLKRNWELASKRASLGLTGYNLWIHWHCIGDDFCIRTLESLTNLVLLPVDEHAEDSSSSAEDGESSGSSGG